MCRRRRGVRVTERGPERQGEAWLVPPRDPVAVRVVDVVEPLLAREGFALVDLEYRPVGRASLRLYVDRAGRRADAGDDGEGVTLDDLTDLTRLLSDTLDVVDPIPGPYELEISSPGLDRPLTRRSDFEAVVGHNVRVRTAVKIVGRRRFAGELLRVDAGALALRVDGNEIELPVDEIASAHLEYRPTTPSRHRGRSRSR